MARKENIGISHQPKRRPNGITKADREARKSDDLLKREEMACLCWTYSPEVSYALKYKPAEIQDSEIIKMAESAEEQN